MQQQMRTSTITICAATFVAAFMISGCYVDRPAYDGVSTETIFEEARDMRAPPIYTNGPAHLLVQRR